VIISGTVIQDCWIRLATRPESGLSLWLRNGRGEGLGAVCWSAVKRPPGHAGFIALELVATLPGHRLYRRHGYEGDERVRYELPGGVRIDFIPMRKRLPKG
jgi:hypothetical protein